MKRIILLLVASALLSGCAGSIPYEYRYRIFYGLDLSDKEQLSAEEFSRLFYPMGSLNRSLDLFGQEGFTLYNYQRLGESPNYKG